MVTPITGAVAGSGTATTGAAAAHALRGVETVTLTPPPLWPTLAFCAFFAGLALLGWWLFERGEL